MKYELIQPDYDTETAYMEYYKSWLSTGEPFTPWVSSLRGMDFEEWLLDIEFRRIKPIGQQVASTLFAFCKNGKIIGFIDLRHSLNAILAKVGGHIGYGIHPLYRGNGYAPIMLDLCLTEAHLMGFKEILITCNKTNTPSKCTIEHCGGVFESEYLEPDGNIVLRYWIPLK